MHPLPFHPASFLGVCQCIRSKQPLSKEDTCSLFSSMGSFCMTWMLPDVNTGINPIWAEEAYWERNISTTTNGFCYQTHTHHDGDVIDIALSQKHSVIVIELRISGSKVTTELLADIPVESAMKMSMHNDFLFFFEDVNISRNPLQLFHLPMQRRYHISVENSIFALLDLKDLQVYTTNHHILLMLPDSDNGCTAVGAYPFPNPSSSIEPKLLHSHMGSLPFSLRVAQVLHRPSVGNIYSRNDTMTLFLGLAHVNFQPEAAPAKAVLFEILLSSSSNTIRFTLQGSLDVDIDSPNLDQTSLFATSRLGSCLAVSCTVPGSVYRKYHVQYGPGFNNSIQISTLLGPEPDYGNGRVVGFDGLRGRLCLICGSFPSRIRIIEYI
ncbi:hypothetical protein AMATHDRAFT_38467 [Amanita thiersii Skay4041]|uniref:Uncharacterized protein n=1 Tax=Amanita thiersii Skay4041 TaxID=703135 RepID=A0A2A9NZP0_9AGAR|nr:hypothetical protein AMATHDRAFT_38467 [Amanita thiersii Skay4041]